MAVFESVASRAIEPPDQFHAPILRLSETVSRAEQHAFVSHACPWISTASVWCIMK
jgi:hypothetical protein